jgi:beta-phosphoglucomutase-like phosphatase (HAD superfamily)
VIAWPETVDVLLCDADGNLFPSEEPAFVASARVTNAFLAAHGVTRRYTPEELRLATTGKNFRTTASELVGGDAVPARIEEWVRIERDAVTAHLAQTLRPDGAVCEPLLRLARRHRLAAVSSSALVRLEACFAATALDDLFPPEVRFSAEDSLPVPASKPDPAVYVHALERLGVPAERSLAIEDSVPGVLSAVAAGIPTAGNVQFVPPGERTERAAALLEAGAARVLASWDELAAILAAPCAGSSPQPLLPA